MQSFNQWHFTVENNYFPLLFSKNYSKKRKEKSFLLKFDLDFFVKLLVLFFNGYGFDNDRINGYVFVPTDGTSCYL